MSILPANQLPSAAQNALRKKRQVRIAKAQLALMRIQSLLGLSDDELLQAARRVTDLDDMRALIAPPKKP